MTLTFIHGLMQSSMRFVQYRRYIQNNSMARSSNGIRYFGMNGVEVVSLLFLRYFPGKSKGCHMESMHCQFKFCIICPQRPGIHGRSVRFHPAFVQGERDPKIRCKKEVNGRLKNLTLLVP